MMPSYWKKNSNDLKQLMMKVKRSKCQSRSAKHHDYRLKTHFNRDNEDVEIIKDFPYVH